MATDKRGASGTGGRKAGTRPIQRRLKADARRERIIEAAIELFSINSYEDTKIEEIAAAASCTTGPVYHFFSGKEDIYLAAYEVVAARYGQQMRVALEAEKDPLSKIVDICHRFYDLPIAQASEFARSGLRVLGYREVLHRQRAVRNIIRDLLHEAMLSGQINPSPPEPLAHLIFGMAIEALSLVGISENTERAVFDYRNAIEALVMGLRAR